MSALFLAQKALLIGQTLIVSDLHLEKGTNRPGFVPPYDTRQTLGLLAGLVHQHRPERLIFLGDTFDDLGGPSRLGAEDRLALEGLLTDREVIWILGNHDPLPEGALPGLITPEFAMGPYVFRHEAAPDHSGPLVEVSGHFHPCAKVRVRGAVLRRPCFVEAKNRIILPALGAYTGGLNVLDAAFAPLTLGDFRVHVLGRGKVFCFGMESLVA